MYIGIHYYNRIGKEHTLRKIIFYTKQDLFEYMANLSASELPFKWTVDKRKTIRL